MSQDAQDNDPTLPPSFEGADPTRHPLAVDFDQRWRGGSEPDILEFVNGISGDTGCHDILWELISIDITARWRSAYGGDLEATVRHPAWKIERYQATLREWLGDRPVPLRVLAHEYLARRSAGDPVMLDEYQGRFEVDPRRLSIEAERIEQGTLGGMSDPTATIDFSAATDRAHDTSRLGGADTLPNRAADQSVSVPGPAVGQAFGDFHIVREVARGGMGVVFEARQLSLNRTVALKMILTGQLASEADIQRFRTEAEAAANLNHPGIVPVYEVGELGGYHYISMGFVDGASLAMRLIQGPLGNREAAEIIQQVAEAVGYAHQGGVIHRDLKPGNILMESSGQPRVTDFGLAKRTESDSELTGTGQILGTPSYMPPEQASGITGTVGPAADVYALGAVLYALLSGRPPFQSASVIETIKQVLEQEPLPPRQFSPAIDRDLETICLKCLRKERAERYESAQALANDLQRFLRSEPILARRLNVVQRTWRWCKRKPVAAGLCVTALVAVMAVAAAGVWIQRARQAEQQFELTRTLANLQNRLNQQLDRPAANPNYIDTVHLLLGQIEELDADAARDSKTRVIQRYGEFLREQIYQARLTDEDQQSLAGTMDAFASLDTDLAAQLRAELAAKSRQWRDLFTVTTPFDDVGEYFAPEVIQRKKDQLFCGDSDTVRDRRLILSNIASDGDVEVLVEFGPKWQQSSHLGVIVDGRDSGEAAQGLEFVIYSLPRKVDGKTQYSSFELARRKDEELTVAIFRDRLALRQVALPASQLGETLRIRAARRGSSLSFQINDLTPIEINQTFVVLRKGGVVGLTTPRNHNGMLPLQRLRARAQDAAAAPSPLTQADQLYTEGDFTGALEIYQQQAVTNTDQAIARESLFKQAMCCLQLKQSDDATAILQGIIEKEDRWGSSALGQLWVQAMLEQRWADADGLALRIENQAEFGEVARQIPISDIDRVYQLVRDISDVSVRLHNPDDGLVRNLERFATTLELLDTSRGTQLTARRNVVDALEARERYPEAYERALSIATTFTDFDSQSQIFATLVGLGMRVNKQDEVLALMDKRLYPQADRVLDARYIWLLTDKARLYANVQRWDDAAACLDLEIEKDKVRDQDFLWACLYRGYLYELQGEPNKAQEIWRIGFQRARERRFDDYTMSASGFLGSLTNELNVDDVNVMIENLSEIEVLRTVSTVLRNQLFPVSLFTGVIRNTWQTPEGRELMGRILWSSESHVAMNDEVAKLVGIEFCRQTINGSQNLHPPLTPLQKQVLFPFAQRMMQAYNSDELGETHALQAAMAYKGQTNFLGWGGLKGRLPPEIRGPLAWILGCHFRHEGQPAAARAVLEEELEAAEADSPLFQVIQAELQQLASEDTQATP